MTLIGLMVADLFYESLELYLVSITLEETHLIHIFAEKNLCTSVKSAAH